MKSILRFHHTARFVLVLFLGCTAGLHGQPAPATLGLVPNFLFSDNMVLQRDREAPVWGHAAPGANVRISLLDKTATALANQDGKWSAKIGPFKHGGPFEMTIESGSERKTIRNVMVGDVWFCSGQSNMWWSVQNSKDGAKEVPLATHSKIRLLTIPQRSASAPKSDLTGPTWSECSPESIKEFSAVAYYFGRSLQQHNCVPVALINSSWGGSAIQSWTSLASLETDPDLVGITAPYYSVVRRFDKDLAAGIVDDRDAYIDKGPQPNELGWEAPSLDDSAWKEWAQPGDFGSWGKPEYVQGGIWFRRSIDIPADWTGKALILALGDIGNYDITYVNGVEVGRTDKAALAAKAPSRREYTIPADLLKPGSAVIAVRTFNAMGPGGIRGFPEWFKRDIDISTADNPKNILSLKGPWKYKVGHALSPRGITADTLSHKLPSGLFNAMVAPVIPFGIRGIAWYQGEQNTGNAWEYRAQFPLMIRSWRDAWGEDIPFLYVQLPGLGKPSTTPTEDSQYNESWNELRDAQWRGLDEPRTAMITTIDLGDGNIHPANKHDVGARLALAARAVAHGEKIDYSGPLYAGFKTEGSKIRVKFTHTGAGLGAKDSADGALNRFAIAGSDRNYVWAEARIEGDTVIVWNDAVPSPVAVSYAWAINPVGANLYNQAGLPAASFRSDDWPMRTLGKKAPY